MTGIQLRPYALHDLGDVHHLCMRVIHSSYAGVYPPNAILHFEEHHTPEQIAADASAGCTLVAEVSGRLVGTGTVVGNDVRRVFVEPTCQRQGIGRRLMVELEDTATRHGVRTLGLCASLPARAFYEALGYRLRAEKASDVGRGQELRYFEMVKAL